MSRRTDQDIEVQTAVVFTPADGLALSVTLEACDRIALLRRL